MQTTMLQRVVRIISAVLVAACVQASFPLNQQVYAKGSVRIGESPPQITTTDLAGSTVRIPEDVRGKVVVLHFWAVGCSSCRENIPALDDLYVKYKKKGLIVLAINVGQKKDTIQAFLAGLRISYPVLLDTSRKIATEYEVVSVPRTFILDRNGTIRFKIVGDAKVDAFHKFVGSLL